MVRGRIGVKTKRRFKESIRDVIKGMSRKVKVYKKPVISECPNCYYDKMTGKSTGKCRWTLEEVEQKQSEYEVTNPSSSATMYKWFRVGRCPVCKGKGVLETLRKKWVHCLVIWNPQNRYNNEIINTPAGLEGSTLVQLKTHPRNFDLFHTCTRVIVDGIECKISKPPVLRGLGNQSVLIITAYTEDKIKEKSGELIKDYDY